MYSNVSLIFMSTCIMHKALIDQCPFLTPRVTRIIELFLLLQTRIAMALPHACVSCYYVCYAENPKNLLFDKTIPERIQMLHDGRDYSVPTPRVPRRFTT